MKEDTDYFLEEGDIRYRDHSWSGSQPAVGGAAGHRRYYPVTVSLEIPCLPAQRSHCIVAFCSGLEEVF